MLLSETHPRLWREVVRYPGGLHVVHVPGEQAPTLLIKLPHRFLLTARMNGGFRIFVVPVAFEHEATVGLMCVFDEDPTNPLYNWTPLFADPHSQALSHTILRDRTLTARLLDEHDRELLAYECTVECPLVARIRLEHARLVPISHELAHGLAEAAHAWLDARSPQDEADAVQVRFASPLYAQDRTFRDERKDLYGFHGSKGFNEVPLVKREPGQFQELDIILLLQRVFEPENIYHSPLRITDREEICDVLVITEDLCLVVQAKDSPNTEQMLGNSLARKRQKAKQQLAEGCNQVSGAIGYLRRNQPLQMLADDQEVTVDLEGRNVLSLVVVRELFVTDYAEYSATLLALHARTELPCIGIDYQELIQYSTFCRSQRQFEDAYFQVFDFARENGQFPRLRFGVRDLFAPDGRFLFD